MMNEKHLSILKQGVEVWNKWRKDNSDKAPDLSRAYLSDADLSKINLRKAYLIDAYLSRAKLSDANLNKANLRKAYLIDAYLSRAKLSDVDLKEADLSRAHLTEADLRN